ncbi:SOS response-associated peptidase [Lachnotalea glycerini]|jgi:putative SOS response-associated peptidase YedK|uniref:Abasic site processing protein n=1 Tax=Lachnotalea glycerini TaxID=1763509 RepID=A0A371J584_9FIRM|nr:SOS response-associated peptidase [Lachnotalea glycerini]RDY27951.1 SOS response-associated peptidase [Lachnotalea glycerini]
MCGRYYIDEETAMELQKIVLHIDKKLNPAHYSRDIVPSALAPVITNGSNEMSLELFNWGFLGYNQKGLIINARAETVSEKKSFKDCLADRRCIIPAKGFYEWDQSRNKFTFQNTKKRIMLMAGLYNADNRFVIITTKANESMEKIHDRMPLVLSDNLVHDWLFDSQETINILNKMPPLLERSSDMEQMRLEFY